MPAGIAILALLIGGCTPPAGPVTDTPAPPLPSIPPTGTPVGATPSPALDASLYEPAPPVGIEEASTAFDDPTELDGWRVSQGEAMDGGTTTFEFVDGALRVEAAQSKWLDRSHGWSAGRTIEGDIVVTLLIHVTGVETDIPTIPWSLAGLMLRAPTTDPAQESWIHWTSGRVGEPVLERKETRGGRSELDLIRVPAGLIELRILRHGASVALFHRSEGGPWTLDHVYVRTDLPPALELLITTQTGAESDRGDLVASFHRLDVAPSPLSGELAEMLSAGRTVDAQQLLDALGG